MQFIVISHQIWEICAALLLGVFLGLIYDICRFVRAFLLPIDKNLVICNIIDVLYLIFAGASYCVFIYSASSGRFRWFTAFGLLLGVLLYRLLPSRIIYPVFKWLANVLIKLVRYLLHPIKALLMLIKKAIASLLSTIKRKKLIAKTDKFKSELSSDIQFNSIG